MKWFLSILAFGGSSGEAKPMEIEIEQVDRLSRQCAPEGGGNCYAGGCS